jgi:hypothetical protein
LACEIGEGLFIAGSSHVAMMVQAAPHEHTLITSNPSELNKMEEEKNDPNFAPANPQF